MPFYQDISSAMSQKNTHMYNTHKAQKHWYCPYKAFSRDICASIFYRFLAVVRSLGDLPNVLKKIETHRGRGGHTFGKWHTWINKGTTPFLIEVAWCSAGPRVGIACNKIEALSAHTAATCRRRHREPCTAGRWSWSDHVSICGSKRLPHSQHWWERPAGPLGEVVTSFFCSLQLLLFCRWIER